MPQASKAVVRISFFMDSQIVAQFITSNPDRYRRIAIQPPKVPLGSYGRELGFSRCGRMTVKPEVMI
jgi:hypothetical protein